MPTRPPPTCAAAASPAALRPPLLPGRPRRRPCRRLGLRRRAFVAAGRLIEVAGKRTTHVSEHLIDPEVAERVLAGRCASGGDFAEVFAERRAGLGMAIDESRIESVQSGAEEGAGVRVVDAGTTYFAHVDGLDPADLERAADEAASALRGERAEPRPLSAVETTPQPIERRPEEVPAERKAALLRELDERGRGAGAEVDPGARLLRRGAPRGHRRQLRGPLHRRRPHPHPDRRPGGRPPRRRGRDRARDARRPPRLRAARRRPRRDRRRRRRARRWPCSTPARPRRARCRSSSAAASAASSSTR